MITEEQKEKIKDNITTLKGVTGVEDCFLMGIDEDGIAHVHLKVIKPDERIEIDLSDLSIVSHGC